MMNTWTYNYLVVVQTINKIIIIEFAFFVLFNLLFLGITFSYIRLEKLIFWMGDLLSLVVNFCIKTPSNYVCYKLN